MNITHYGYPSFLKQKPIGKQAFQQPETPSPFSVLNNETIFSAALKPIRVKGSGGYLPRRYNPVNPEAFLLPPRRLRKWCWRAKRYTHFLTNKLRYGF